jgi:hypothetical protein
MHAVIDRDYCLRHPAEIIRLYGLGVFLGMLIDKRMTLLERVTRNYQATRIPLPGPVGNAYRLSALIEYRISRIYAALADRFADDPEAARLFADLSAEEEEHGRVMLACLFHVKHSPTLRYVPSLLDPEIRATLIRLRTLKKQIHSLSLDAALELTAELEGGEVNVIFERLLRQVDAAQLVLCAERLAGALSHSESVPRRMKTLRAQRGQVGQGENTA